MSFSSFVLVLELIESNFEDEGRFHSKNGLITCSSVSTATSTSALNWSVMIDKMARFGTDYQFREADQQARH